MRLVTDEHTDLRRAVQSARLDVPAGAPEHRVACGRQAHRIADSGAGRQAEARVSRQVQQLEHPRTGDLLGRRRRG